VRAVTKVNTVQAPKRSLRKPTRHNVRGRPPRSGKRARYAPDRSAGVVVMARTREDLCATREVCVGAGRTVNRRQRLAREGWSRPEQMVDGLVIPTKPGNSGGGKGP
jgi:hypothetical protein